MNSPFSFNLSSIDDLSWFGSSDNSISPKSLQFGEQSDALFNGRAFSLPQDQTEEDKALIALCLSRMHSGADQSAASVLSTGTFNGEEAHLLAAPSYVPAPLPLNPIQRPPALPLPSPFLSGPLPGISPSSMGVPALASMLNPQYHISHSKQEVAASPAPASAPASAVAFSVLAAPAAAPDTPPVALPSTLLKLEGQPQSDETSIALNGKSNKRKAEAPALSKPQNVGKRESEEAENSEVRKAKRRKQNREAAQKSRDKKKAYQESLEKRVKELMVEHARKQQQIEQMEAENRALREALAHFCQPLS